MISRRRFRTSITSWFRRLSKEPRMTQINTMWLFLTQPTIGKELYSGRLSSDLATTEEETVTSSSNSSNIFSDDGVKSSTNTTTKSKKSAAGRLEASIHKQTVMHMKPLLNSLEAHNCYYDIRQHLAKSCRLLIIDRNYILANNAYTEMAVGNTPWPVGVTRSGIHQRPGSDKSYVSNIAHVLQVHPGLQAPDDEDAGVLPHGPVEMRGVR